MTRYIPLSSLLLFFSSILFDLINPRRSMFKGKTRVSPSPPCYFFFPLLFLSPVSIHTEVDLKTSPGTWASLPFPLLLSSFPLCFCLLIPSIGITIPYRCDCATSPNIFFPFLAAVGGTLIKCPQRDDKLSLSIC